MRILAPIFNIVKFFKTRRLIAIIAIVLLVMLLALLIISRRQSDAQLLTHTKGSLVAEESLQKALDAKSQDKPDQAIAFIEPVYRGDPENILCLEILAWAKYRQKNYDQSATLYQKLVEKNTTATYLSYLGNSLRDAGKNSEAIKAYEQAIEENMNFNTAYQNLVNAYKSQNWLNKKDLVAFLQKQSSNVDNKLAGGYLEEALKQ